MEPCFWHLFLHFFQAKEQKLVPKIESKHFESSKRKTFQTLQKIQKIKMTKMQLKVRKCKIKEIKHKNASPKKHMKKLETANVFFAHRARVFTSAKLSYRAARSTTTAQRHEVKQVKFEPKRPGPSHRETREPKRTHAEIKQIQKLLQSLRSLSVHHVYNSQPLQCPNSEHPLSVDSTSFSNLADIRFNCVNDR